MDQEMVRKDMMGAKSAKEGEGAEGNVARTEVRWGKIAGVG